MRVLLKKMPKSLNHTNVRKYMSDMGTTAFSNKPCKRHKTDKKQEELSTGEKNISDEYRKESLILNNGRTTAGLLNESTTSI